MDVTYYSWQCNRHRQFPFYRREWVTNERTYNKPWQACSVRSVPSQPRFSPRRSSCRGKCGRQIPAAACWGRCHRMPMVPRSSLSWQCCSSSSPEVLSIDLRPDTSGRPSVSPDYRHRPHTLTKRSDDPLRSQVFPDPLSLPPPAYLHDRTTMYTSAPVNKSRTPSSKVFAPNSLPTLFPMWSRGFQWSRRFLIKG